MTGRAVYSAFIDINDLIVAYQAADLALCTVSQKSSIAELTAAYTLNTRLLG